jgi:hypothetical protein
MYYKIVCILALCLTSCQGDIRDMKSLYHWINDPEHGMIKSKNVNGLTITVKYLPAEFLALKEAKSIQPTGMKVYDSLLGAYKKSHTFLLSFGYEDNKTDDPMYNGLKDFSEFKQRAATLNFDMNELISIRTEHDEFRPVLASMENTYGLKSQRDIYLVFTDESPANALQKDEALDFVFRDEIFQTGINHFVFQQDDLTGLPAINFNTIN